MPYLYKHICGYPIEEGSELTHCPGCGGRITPWNLKPGLEAISATEHACFTHFAAWLLRQHPDLARTLNKAIDQALQGALLQQEQACLSQLYSALSVLNEESLHARA